MSKRRVAIITHDLASGGGTARLTRFLYSVLDSSEDFAPSVVSLATSSSDRASVLTTRPLTWTEGARVIRQQYAGIPYQHAGAIFPEFEFQRYAPRRPLLDLLDGFDMLQFVTGTPSWACVAGEKLHESSVWFATLVRNDRASRVARSHGVRHWNYRVMTTITERLEQKALSEARCLIALSDYSVQAARPFVKADRLRMIPCGVDTGAFLPDPAVQGNHILCVGRLVDPRKNIKLLLDAWRDAVSRDPSVPNLCLVGDPAQGELKTDIERGPFASRVHMAGYKTDEELADLYRRAMMLAVSSDEEGLGIVILEAMASGIPVVSTRCGGPETAVVDGVTGLLSPVGDRAGLRDSILRVAGDQALRRRMGEAGLARAREVFSLQVTGERFLELYRSGVTAPATGDPQPVRV